MDLYLYPTPLKSAPYSAASVTTERSSLRGGVGRNWFDKGSWSAC